MTKQKRIITFIAGGAIILAIGLGSIIASNATESGKEFYQGIYEYFNKEVTSGDQISGTVEIILDENGNIISETQTH